MYKALHHVNFPVAVYGADLGTAEIIEPAPVTQEPGYESDCSGCSHERPAIGDPRLGTKAEGRRQGRGETAGYAKCSNLACHVGSP